MKLNLPIHKTINTVADETVTITRDDYGVHYTNCIIHFDEDLKELDDLIFTKCIFESDTHATHMTDVSFINCNIQNIAFENVSFRRAHFKDSLMTGFTLNNVNLKDVHFEQCKMNLFNIADSQFDGVHFNQIDGHDGYLYNITTKKWTLTASLLNNLSIVDTSLKNIDLSESEIDGITVSANDLAGCTVNTFQSTALIQLFGIQVK